ncbi:MAG: tyrosine-type recombinase/integrase [Geobacter sp.]
MASISKYEGKKGTTYKVTIRMKGYPTQTETFKRLTDAKRWAQDTESSIRDGRHFKTIEAKKHTVADMIDRYVKHEIPKKPKSSRVYLQQLAWWKDKLGSYTLDAVTAPLIVECRDSLVGAPINGGKTRAGATANRYLAALSHCISVAVKEWGWLESNPLSKVTRAREAKGRVRFLESEERAKLLEACRTSRNKHLYLIALLAISTGARQGEILGLTWDDVMFESRRIILRDTKNTETRAVPLVGPAFDLLKEHNKVRRLDTKLVFPREGIHSNRPISIRESWERAIEKAGIQNFRFHDLRHTCASYLAMNGATLAEIAEILGHKTLQMVKRYAHLSDQHVSSVVERMNQAVFGGQQ